MANAGAEIYKVLRGKGYTPAQAAGVVGNARQESGLNPRASGGGLFQGIGGRSRLGRGNARQQVETALREEPAAWAALRRTHTPQEAARVFSQKFERPGTPMVGNRERYAGEAARQYAGLPPSTRQIPLGPSAVSKLPGISFDAAGFEKAQKAGILGRLLSGSGERKDNPLFATGLVSTKLPQRSEYETEKPEAVEPAKLVKHGNASVYVPPSKEGAPPVGGYPLAKVGHDLGGPSAHKARALGNWESDNAIDLGVPNGTPVYAVADGTIGSQIGSLGSGNPKLAGLRLHLVTHGNEFYYAHLKHLSVKAGQSVRKGQLLGYSGEANGAQHLHIASKNGNPEQMFVHH